MKKNRALLIILFMLQSLSARAAEDSLNPPKQMSGSMTLLSHFVENSLTQSNKLPAIQGALWFNVGQQFRLGVWGSNTNYIVGDDNFNLRVKADLKINFSSSAQGIIGYSDSKYFKGGEHNGNITSFDLNFTSFRVSYSRNSNWQASNSSATRYALEKNLRAFFDGWDWDNEIGFCSPSGDTISPYLDFRTALGRRFSAVYLDASLTGTSASTSLNGDGDIFFILSAKTEF
jgi:uncharacterized protein (TIGR02001 family)